MRFRWNRRRGDRKWARRLLPTTDHAGYVAIYGTARIVADPEEKSSRWKEEWEAFYTDREAQYLLLQVTPERLEVINYSRAMGGIPNPGSLPRSSFPGVARIDTGQQKVRLSSTG